jgi:transposase
MLTTRHGERLGDWMRDVNTNGAPALRSFVAGLSVDLDAVTAGLTLDYNSGAVEGTVNRIKIIKQQMFGRARFDLLRKRILNPPERQQPQPARNLCQNP